MIDKYLTRIRTKDYNCYHFVAEVWKDLTGEDAPAVFNGRAVSHTEFKKARPIAWAINPCFVLMHRKGYVPHVGIYYNGKILHLTETCAMYQPLINAKRYFTRIEYYI